MSAKVAKESSRFLWLGNTPFVDFVNTEMVRGGRPVDLLREVKDIFEWFDQAGFRVEANSRLASAQSADKLLHEAHAYRRALRSALQIIATKGSVPSEILHKTNHYLLRKNHWFELTNDADGLALRDHWTIEYPEDVCSPIAQSFARFLASAELDRLRKCKNPECVLFFYDTSKSGTRVWCSLDTCGNKMRVAAFRQREDHKKEE